MSSNVATVSRSSTTRTTPTRRPPPPRYTRWWRSGAGGGPSRCWATSPSSATTSEPVAPIGAGAAAVGSWGGKAVQVTDQQAAVALLREELRAGDVVLVKGSRYRTWEIADSLREEIA